MLGYFVCPGWCGVEVRVNGCDGEGDVLGVPTPGLGCRGGRCSSYFLTGGCLIGVVGVYSCFAIGGGEYRRLIYPGQFPVGIELFGEIGVSSSSGFVLSSLLGMNPRSICWQSCFVVRVSVYHALTR